MNARVQSVTMAAAVALSLALSTGINAAEDAQRQTRIHHSDGTTSTVTTDRYGNTHVLTPGHGGGQFGSSVPHDEVVKQYTRPGSKVEAK